MVQFAITITTSILSGLLLFFITEYFKLKKTIKEKEHQIEVKEKEKQEDRDALLLGVARALLNNMIFTALDRGETTQEEYEIIDGLYQPYIRNGGNGVVKHLFEDRYNKLKVKKGV